MSGNRIFVVGSLHFDIVLNAPHLPQLDETVMGKDVQFVCGGKGGNQAVAASRHGAKTHFAGAVGQDFFAEALLKNLTDAGVDTNQIVQNNKIASGMSVAIVDPNGEYGAVVASEANQMIEPGAIELPANTQILALQNEVPEQVNFAIARKAKTAGVRIVVNAAPMRPMSDELLSFTDILIVNRIEAETLFDQPIHSIDEGLFLLRDNPLKAPTTIITLGKEGLVFASNGTKPKHLDAYPVATISSHGAGDVFVGALCARLTKQGILEDALSYASAAAALHVSTPVEKRDEINEAAVNKLFKA